VETLSPPEVLLYIVDAGGGHRAAGRALVDAAAARGSPLRLEIVSLQSILMNLDWPRHLTGLSIEETYNALVRSNQTRFLVPLLRVLQWTIRRFHRHVVGLLSRDLAKRRPALVVSLLPNFNAPLRDAVRAAHPGVPFAVLLTDFADFPPHFWVERGVDHVIVGSPPAVEQAVAMGVPRAHVTQTSGMVLHPRFTPRRDAAARERLRDDLGISGGAFVVLLLFGGKGSGEMRPLAARLLESSPEIHVIAICGDNPRLFESMASIAQTHPARFHRVGFTRDVPDYLAMADVLATKPGPGSLAEAFHQRVPVIVTRNARTIPQERFNARYVEEKGLGFVVKEWPEIPEVVARLAADAPLRERIQAALAALPENVAVDEAIEAFEQLARTRVLEAVG
jgi:Glycosyltransferase family 28 C-terminal domain